MCGIAGFVAKRTITPEDYKIVLQLTMMNQSRGEDSTGVALVGINGRSVIHKDAIKPVTFAPNQFKEYRKNLKSIITHTRKATTGAVNAKNAHPFQYGHIVGAHNGIVYNKYDFSEFKEKMDVDSEIIFYLLNKYNNDFDKTFGELTGAFGVAWVYDKRPGVLHLMRDGRPLYIAKTNHGYFFSSQEEGLITALLDQEYKLTELEESKVYTLSAHSELVEEIKLKPSSYSSTSNYSYYGTSPKGYGYDDGTEIIGKFGLFLSSNGEKAVLPSLVVLELPESTHPALTNDDLAKDTLSKYRALSKNTEEEKCVYCGIESTYGYNDDGWVCVRCQQQYDNMPWDNNYYGY
jgi:predicted glutamine amidotransferase